MKATNGGLHVLRQITLAGARAVQDADAREAVALLLTRTFPEKRGIG